MTALIQILYSIILGLIQGVSEWLPISSKTQILISSNYLLNLTIQQAYVFGLFMEVATILAAVIYFRREIAILIKVLLGSKDRMQRNLFKFVLFTTIITGIIATPIYLIVSNTITGAPLGIPMLVIGLVLIGDALVIRHSRQKKLEGTAKPRRLSELNFKDYIVVGIVQGIAALPGVSRSGVTTSSMLIMNVEPDEAFRLSFLIGVFVTSAAFILTVLVSKAEVMVAIADIGIVGLAVAIITSTIVSLLLIDFLIKTAAKSKIVYLTAGLGIIALFGGSLLLLGI